MEFNPAKPGTATLPTKGDTFAIELKKLYREFRTYGEDSGQVIMINDPNGMMARFKYGQGEFARFAKTFNKAAMENDIPVYIKLDRKSGRFYLCSKSEGNGFLGMS